MNSNRFKKDSVQFKKESELCELSAKIAEFLEDSVPADSYDFALSDLLYFSDERTLSCLRGNATWQVLEADFMAVGGIVAEDWDDEDEAENSKPMKNLRPVSPWKSRVLGLVLIIVVPAIVGGTLGWFFPNQSLPEVNCAVK
jgi:hypothetical protein